MTNKEKILGAMEPGKIYTPKQISGITSIPHNSAKKIMGRMVKYGVLWKAKRGQYLKATQNPKVTPKVTPKETPNQPLYQRKTADVATGKVTPKVTVNPKVTPKVTPNQPHHQRKPPKTSTKTDKVDTLVDTKGNGEPSFSHHDHDKTDTKIAEYLIIYKLSQREIGRRLKLSKTAINKRVQRMATPEICILRATKFPGIYRKGINFQNIIKTPQPKIDEYPDTTRHTNRPQFKPAKETAENVHLNGGVKVVHQQNLPTRATYPLRVHALEFMSFQKAQKKTESTPPIPWGNWSKIGNGTRQRQASFPIIMEDGRQENVSITQYRSRKGIRSDLKISHPPIYVSPKANPDDAKTDVLNQLYQFRDWLGKTYGLMLGDLRPIRKEEIAIEGHPTAQLANNKYSFEINNRTYYWDESIGVREAEIKGENGIEYGVAYAQQNELLMQIWQRQKQSNKAIESLSKAQRALIEIASKENHSEPVKTEEPADPRKHKEKDKGGMYR